MAEEVSGAFTSEGVQPEGGVSAGPEGGFSVTELWGRRARKGRRLIALPARLATAGLSGWGSEGFGLQGL